MNDQAKCRGEECAVRQTCDRYVRPESDRQTWLIVPAHAQNSSCVLRVPVEDTEKVGRWEGGRWIVSAEWAGGAK